MESKGLRRRRGRPRKKPKIEPEEMVSYEELQAKVQILEENNKKLTKLLSRGPVSPMVYETEKLEKRKKTKNIACYPKRQVLLKIAYLGWDYQSCASQEDIQKTVEDKLLQALLKISLIDALDTSKFQRCGKASQGFNSFDQVVSIVLRSRLASGLGVIPFERNGVTIKEEPHDEDQHDDDNIDHEIKYTDLIMEEAAQHLLGHHNYISLYKRDSSKGLRCLYRQTFSFEISPSCCDLRAKDDSKPVCDPVEYIRIHTQTESENERETESDDDVIDGDQDGSRLPKKIKHLPQDLATSTIKKKQGCKRTLSSDGYDMCVATIKAREFLWDEIRKVMAVLFQIGEGKARPETILEIVDVKASHRTPQPSVASEMPLNLYRTNFEEENWRWDNIALRLVISRLQAFWSQQAVRATSLRHTLWDFESCYLENASRSTQEELDTQDLPHDQCENLIAREKVHVFLSHSKSASGDHMYFAQKPNITAVDSKNKDHIYSSQRQTLPTVNTKYEDDADFNHTATLLLIELIRQRFQRFLLMHTRPTVYKEVQEEMCFRGFSFSLEKIRRKWNSLISTYQKIKERSSDDYLGRITWNYYQLLDDLLGTTVLAMPPTDSVEALAPKPRGDLSHLQVKRPLADIKPIITKKSTADTTSVHVVQPTPTQATLPQAPHQSTAPITTLLHHDGESIFATQTIASSTLSEEKHLKNTSDTAAIFLEYNLQRGEKRLDKIEQHLIHLAEKATKKMVYRRKKEEREEFNLKALRDIGRASEKLKNGLLEI
ncbi:tRNA pseudouridine(38/39) synthase-like 2 [Homarus americanus]|uniref:tRNA pseudouridine(38/39) synthase-like 2 n=1 Tax=Homarus americanus TaxID=6706 RepID=A0A8J5MN47_HOMAM|nr:tRNA pseudouridine(38/39) synthase-like 2 [Homarus americanus]